MYYLVSVARRGEAWRGEAWRGRAPTPTQGPTYPTLHYIMVRSGTIPSCIYTNFSELDHLQLDMNELVGTISDSICGLGDSFTSLELAVNRLSGECDERNECNERNECWSA